MKKIKWNSVIKKIKEIDRMQEIKIENSKEKIKKIIRAIHTSNYPAYISLLGRKFFLKL